MARSYDGSNQYNATPRKIHDKHVDRMKEFRARDREDHRADMQALIKRLNNLETQLTLLSDQMQEQITEVAGWFRKHGREGL